jgi:hypothetical protein
MLISKSLANFVYSLVLSVTIAVPSEAQDGSLPIIDVHLHAFPVSNVGPGVPETSPGTSGLDFRVPATDEENLDQTLAQLRALNVAKAIVSGQLERAWVAADSERFVPGFSLGDPRFGSSLNDVTPQQIITDFEAGRLAVLGEVTTQYLGISPADPALDPYFEAAAQAGIPVHIHTAGVGAWLPGFRASAGRPLLLEDVLVRHPDIRIYLENAGYPFLDDMLALFFQYPERVYADVSTVIRVVPREEFYRYLEALIVAGFGDRIMYGSDQVLWPENIGRSIQILDEAPFLSEDQKRDIFYNNAMRFFGFED